jgi:alpha-mannosidase
MRDPGSHVFEHRVLPYVGRWQDAGIVDLAEAFNAPLPMAPGSVATEGIIGVPTGVCVSTIKAARNGRGLVVRLAEMTGQAREFLLHFPGRRYYRTTRTNFLEDDLAPMDIAGGAVSIKMKPWEILTFRLE